MFFFVNPKMDEETKEDDWELSLPISAAYWVGYNLLNDGHFRKWFRTRLELYANLWLQHVSVTWHWRIFPCLMTYGSTSNAFVFLFFAGFSASLFYCSFWVGWHSVSEFDGASSGIVLGALMLICQTWCGEWWERYPGCVGKYNIEFQIESILHLFLHWYSNSNFKNLKISTAILRPHCRCISYNPHM